MTQEQQIFDYLKAGNNLSPIEALDMFGCFRLAARIHKLREAGHDIKTKMVTKGKKTWAVYYMEAA